MTDDDVAPSTHLIQPSDTSIVLSTITSSADTNLMGTIHGGNVMKLVDDAAGAVSARFSGGPAVTAAMDEMIFRAPVFVGDVLTVRAQVNWAGRSSLEVGARVETTRWDTVADPIHVATAYLVMVAVDQQGNPRHVPALAVVTPTDVRRHRQAELRRQHRLEVRRAIETLKRSEGS